MSNLIYPGDPSFYQILHSTPPPNWRETANRDQNYVYLCPDPFTGILTPATEKEAEEYCLGGAYDEWDEIYESDELWLPS